MPTADPSATSASVPWAQVGVFVAIALVAPWLILLPFHLGAVPFEGLAGMLAAVGMMWVPLVATAVTVALFDRQPGWWRRLGLGVPGGRWGRWIGVMLAALLVPIGLNMLAPFVGALLGWLELDLANFSGLRELLATQLEGTGMTVEQALGGIPLWVMVAVAPVNFILGAVINVFAGAFGEEIGWRGYLQPRLAPLGSLASMVLVGLVWGVWHAPILLLGHNYPTAPVLGVFLFIPFCVIWAILLGWTRQVTGSVWPAALAHGAINASAGFTLMVVAAGSTVDPVWVSAVGVSGWLLPALVSAVVVGLTLARRT